MFIDATLRMADGDSYTTSHASTSYIDTTVGGGSKYVLFGDAKVMPYWIITIGTVVSGGTSVAFSLQTCAEPAFGSPTTLCSTGAILVATLIAGYRTAIRIPKGVLRYIRTYTTVVGPISGGTWTSDIVLDIDSDLQGEAATIGTV